MSNEIAGDDGSASFGRFLSEARSGSAPSLGEVLETCRAYLLSVASREIQSDLQAKIAPSDLVQETCVEAQRHFSRFEGSNRDELLAWLRSILHRRLQKAHQRFRVAAKRSIAREVQLNGFSSIIDPASCNSSESSFPGFQLLAEEDADRLAQALSQLSDEYQTVIRLRNWELRSFADIGLLMNRSPDAARTLWSRAVQCLAKHLG